MTEKNSNTDTNKMLFVHLVTMLSMSAMQQMGKIINPMTGKTEMNLEAAQATIDMLDMLAAKTRNNLDADEERLMKDTLSALKMNFVETSSERQKTEGGGQQSEVRDQSDSKAQAAESDENKAKFHKSYE